MLNKSSNEFIEFGHRLREIRTYLELTQQQVADLLNLNQLQLTRLETGKGGSIRVLHTLLSYYSNFVYIDFLFSKNFEILRRSGEFKKTSINSVILEKLKILQNDLDSTINYLK